MGTRTPQVDAYIDVAPAYAQPILTYLRDAVHAGCAEVAETLKWGVPHFEHQGVLCSMAAFKKHCMFGFWKAALIVDSSGKQAGVNLGQGGRYAKVTQLSELPSKKVIVGYVKQAVKLNAAGIKTPTKAKPRQPAKPPTVPAGLAKALAKNKAAQKQFAAFSASCQREYVEWINDAKTEPTRERRLATAIEWIAAGKSRNWKYKKKT